MWNQLLPRATRRICFARQATTRMQRCARTQSCKHSCKSSRPSSKLSAHCAWSKQPWSVICSATAALHVSDDNAHTTLSRLCTRTRETVVQVTHIRRQAQLRIAQAEDAYDAKLVAWTKDRDARIAALSQGAAASIAPHDGEQSARAAAPYSNA